MDFDLDFYTPYIIITFMPATGINGLSYIVGPRRHNARIIVVVTRDRLEVTLAYSTFHYYTSLVFVRCFGVFSYIVFLHRFFNTIRSS